MDKFPERIALMRFNGGLGELPGSQFPPHGRAAKNSCRTTRQHSGESSLRSNEYKCAPIVNFRQRASFPLTACSDYGPLCQLRFSKCEMPLGSREPILIKLGH